MSTFLRAASAALLLLTVGVMGCEDALSDTNHNNDTETDVDTNIDGDETANLVLEFDVFGTTEDCELVVTGHDRAPIVCATGDPCTVPANVDLTIDIRGGVHETPQDPGYVVTRRQTVRLASGETKTVTVKGNPAWLNEQGEEWFLLDCRFQSVNNPDDQRAATTSGGIGVEDGYRLCFNIGRDVCIEFNGTDGVMIDESENDIVDGTLEITRDGLSFEEYCSGCNSNFYYTCTFDD